MSTLEMNFIREFRYALRNRKISKNINEVPLPKLNWVVNEYDMFYIKGISDKVFSELNGKYVIDLKGMIVKKKVYDLVTRSFKKDKEGNFIYEDVEVPRDSRVISTKVKLQVPYGYRSDKGFSYVDTVKRKDCIYFIYTIPNTYLHKVNQTALAISTRKLNNYEGKLFRTWNCGAIGIYVIPYKPNRKYIGTRILATGTSLNYSDYITAILNYWQSEEVNFIPNIMLSETKMGNLTINDIAPTENMYYPYETLSLKDKEVFNDEETEEEITETA